MAARRIHDGALYGPDTVTWQVNRESVLLLGGPRALLLQVAHPAVAAGVAEHSDFERDPFGRLRRTLEVMTTIGFGPPAAASDALARLAAIHARVTGTVAETGEAYTAGTPDLLWWVLATLIDTALVVEQRYLGRLDDADREQYYREAFAMIDAFGIPRAVVPPTLAGFRAFMAEQCATLVPTETSRRLARSIMRPPIPFVPPPVWDLVSVVTVDLLPRPLRDAYGLRSTRNRKRLLRASQAAGRAVLPRLPELVRTFPQFV